MSRENASLNHDFSAQIKKRDAPWPCLTLRRMRRSRLGIGLQWLALAGIILQPLPMARSYWTDSDGNGAKEWVADPPAGDSWFVDDSDGDQLTNEEEVIFGSDPYSLDSDHDGLVDKDERDLTQAMNGGLATTDPWSWDSDLDGYSDHDEYYAWLQGSSPMVNYNNLPSGPTWSGGTFFSYFDADGDGIHNQDDMEPVNMDRDNDGILNWQDGYMDDHWNGAGDPNSGNNGNTDPGVYIGGIWYPTGTLDSDYDGNPDHTDPFPWGSYTYNGVEYGGSWSDQDGDSIPDGADLFPSGSYLYNGAEYGGGWVDQDNDGVPDPADPWPSTAGSFWYNGTEHEGFWQDADGDNIPDIADAWPNSAWNGEPYFTYNNVEYAGEWVDRDNDWVPDPADNWPDDPENGIDTDGDGLDNYSERTAHLTDPASVDSDNDFLTDYEELYVFHTHPLLAISHPESGQTVLDGYLHMGADWDGDELPDLIEDHYASLGFALDKTNPADAAGDLDGDGVTNLQAYQQGLSLIVNLNQYDQDGDGITDPQEDYWSTLYPGILDRTLFADAVADFDHDGVLNFEEILYGLDPGNANSHVDETGQPLGDLAYLNATYPLGWVAATGPDTGRDTDGDGMPDVWEYQHHLDLRSNADPTLDPDGDGLPNELEHQLQTNPRMQDSDPNQAGNDGEADADNNGLSTAQEVVLGTVVTNADTDGDGITDGAEVAAGTDPKDQASLPPSTAVLETRWVKSHYRGTSTSAWTVHWTWSWDTEPADGWWVADSSGTVPGHIGWGAWSKSTGEGQFINTVSEAQSWLVAPGVADPWVVAGQPLEAVGSWTREVDFTGNSLDEPPDFEGSVENITAVTNGGSITEESIEGAIREYRLKRTGGDPSIQLSKSFIKEVTETGLPTTYEGVTLTIPPRATESNTTVTLKGKSPAVGKTHTERLLPIEIVELSPKVKDEEGNDIAGSEKPNSGKPLTPFVEEDPENNRIAHREIKVKIGDALKDKKVTWTLEALPGATPATIRGQWEDSETHEDRFEQSTAYTGYWSRKVSQTTGETTIGADGHTAIRVNVPPIGFNQVRIKIQIEGMSTPIDLIDMEVPGVVVIDPGHGGTTNLDGSNANNATANPSGILEKAMALDYGLALRDTLRQHRQTNRLNLRVFTTRRDDRNREGWFRANVARDNGADVFVSIHFNATNKQARGSEALIRGTDQVNGSEVEDGRLGRCVLDGVLAGISQFDNAFSDRGVKNYAWSSTLNKNVPSSWAVLSDDSYANDDDYHPVRGTIAEIEFIDVPAVDALLNTGGNAGAVKNAVVNGMRDGILNDLIQQPAP